MFIEVTGINEKFIVNTTHVKTVWEYDTFRVIVMSDKYEYHVQETYEELKQLLGATTK